jgi:diacylglycerol kinase (ATP)
VSIARLNADDIRSRTGTPSAKRRGVRATLIVNPTSGGETAVDHLPMLAARLREAFADLDVVVTAAEGDAEDAGRRAVLDGRAHVFVAGGDGTLNEALNGIASADGLGRITLGVIPLGTGNDFATAIGVPPEPEEAIARLLAGRAHPIDVGRVNGRRFLNVSAGGFIAEVSEAVPSKLKTALGKLAYLVGGAQVLLDFEPLQVTIAAETDGASAVPHALSLHAFAICNSRLIGGGRLIAPHAIIDDGWLDVCLIQAMPTIEFLALLRRVSAGDHVDDERVHYFRARTLEIAADRRMTINTDGEVREADRCRYEVLSRALRVLLP